MDIVEVIKLVLQFAAFPLAAWLYALHEKVNSLETKVAVQATQLEGQKALNEQTYAELRSNFTTIVAKLDSIEQFLRK